jgi:hypothetical protein
LLFAQPTFQAHRVAHEAKLAYAGLEVGEADALRERLCYGGEAGTRAAQVDSPMIPVTGIIYEQNLIGSPRTQIRGTAMILNEPVRSRR